MQSHRISIISIIRYMLHASDRIDPIDQTNRHIHFICIAAFIRAFAFSIANLVLHIVQNAERSLFIGLSGLSLLHGVWDIWHGATYAAFVVGQYSCGCLSYAGVNFVLHTSLPLVYIIAGKW